MRHVITLSSIPPRFDKIGPVLTSLLRQSSRPEAVELYIPPNYRRFPQWGGALPEVPEGVTIIRTDQDLGPATKILPAARARRGQDIELLYVDDDWIYPASWAKGCLALRKSHPRTAIASAGFEIRRVYGYDYTGPDLPRALPERPPSELLRYQLGRLLATLLGKKPRDHELAMHGRKFIRSGYVDVAEGYGGVMVQPDFLDDACFDIPPVVWAVDDIWLSGMLARRGIPIWADAELWGGRRLVDTWEHFALATAIIDGADRHQANRACIDHMRSTYGLWGGDPTAAD